MREAEGIRRATTRFVDEIARASAPQWVGEPQTGGWTMSEVTEHVTIANGNVLGVLQRLAPLDGPLGVSDEEIPYLFYGGDEPPEVATPTGTWVDVAEAVRALEAGAQEIVDWALTTGLDLRQSGRRHPVFGTMDGIQWLLFVAAHTWRHRAQLVRLRQTLPP